MAKADGKKSKKADSKPKGEKKAKKAKIDVSGSVDALAKLADHPLVTDLLAVGAMAAVAAIAEHGVAQKNGSAEGSRKAVKAAGKAAAAAIGARLMKEVSGFTAKASASTTKKA